MRLEQLDRARGHRGRARAFMKRATVRRDRRAAKRDPEHAPTKRAYMGWAS